jgi:TolA-binding protein
MKQLASSLPRVKEFNQEFNRGNCSITSELFLFWSLRLLSGFCGLALLIGCKSSVQTPPASSKAADPVQIQIAELAAAIADLRNQNDGLRGQATDLQNQNSDLSNQNAQLRKALEAALEAQEQLTNQVHQLSEELNHAQDDLSLVREQVHDLELDRETKPVGSSSIITAQKPRLLPSP